MRTGEAPVLSIKTTGNDSSKAIPLGKPLEGSTSPVGETGVWVHQAEQLSAGTGVAEDMDNVVPFDLISSPVEESAEARMNVVHNYENNSLDLSEDLNDQTASSTEDIMPKVVALAHNSIIGDPKYEKNSDFHRNRSNRLNTDDDAMQEHHDLFDHPAHDLGYDHTLSNTRDTKDGSVPSDDIIRSTEGEDDTIIKGASVLNENVENLDILSPLGVVGTTVLRKRAAVVGGPNSSIASDEDDRVLMGTATLAPYDSMGRSSLDSDGASTQFDLSQEEQLSPVPVTVPIMEPPAPTSTLRGQYHQPGSGSEELKDGLGSQLINMGIDATVSGSTGTIQMNTPNKSFGEESSELNISQGFVDDITARYLDPEQFLNGNVTNDMNYQDEKEEIEIVKWVPGRASLELIEASVAMDAYVSSIRLDSGYLRNSDVYKVTLLFGVVHLHSL